jgi:hypothetical protein
MKKLAENEIILMVAERPTKRETRKFFKDFDCTILFPYLNPNRIIPIFIEYMEEFKKAVKIGFYRDFLKKGIINSKQFEILMRLQEQND